VVLVVAVMTNAPKPYLYKSKWKLCCLLYYLFNGNIWTPVVLRHYHDEWFVVRYYE